MIARMISAAKLSLAGSKFIALLLVSGVVIGLVTILTDNDAHGRLLWVISAIFLFCSIAGFGAFVWQSMLVTRVASVRLLPKARIYTLLNIALLYLLISASLCFRVYFQSGLSAIHLFSYWLSATSLFFIILTVGFVLSTRLAGLFFVACCQGPFIINRMDIELDFDAFLSVWFSSLVAANVLVVTCCGVLLRMWGNHRIHINLPKALNLTQLRNWLNKPMINTAQFDRARSFYSMHATGKLYWLVFFAASILAFLAMASIIKAVTPVGTTFASGQLALMCLMTVFLTFPYYRNYSSLRQLWLRGVGGRAELFSLWLSVISKSIVIFFAGALAFAIVMGGAFELDWREFFIHLLLLAPATFAIALTPMWVQLCWRKNGDIIQIGLILVVVFFMLSDQSVGSKVIMFMANAVLATALCFHVRHRFLTIDWALLPKRSINWRANSIIPQNNDMNFKGA